MATDGDDTCWAVVTDVDRDRGTLALIGVLRPTHRRPPRDGTGRAIAEPDGVRSLLGSRW